MAVRVLLLICASFLAILLRGRMGNVRRVVVWGLGFRVLRFRANCVDYWGLGYRG